MLLPKFRMYCYYFLTKYTIVVCTLAIGEPELSYQYLMVEMPMIQKITAGLHSIISSQKFTPKYYLIVLQNGQICMVK